MAFKLPRLKANLAIVNVKGHPLDYFLRFWNMDVAPRIEAQIADLTEITNELAYQLLLIQQAQADAEAAALAAAAAQSAANTAQTTAENAQNTADNAFSGSATDVRNFATTANTATFTNVDEILFPARRADGWWEVRLTVSGSSDGLDNNTVEFRLIEQGQATPLVTFTSDNISGSIPQRLVLSPDTETPYPQQAPAGDVTLVLQVRRATGTDSISLVGTAVTSYMPSPT